MPRDPLPLGLCRCLWLHVRGFWRFRVRRWSTWCLAVAILTLLWLMALVVLAFLMCGPCIGGEPSLRPLLDALWQAEASGRLHPPDGDDGRAIGPLQIWKAYWTDAMDQAPDLGGTYQDCRDRAYAEFVAVAYWTRYCPRALERYDFRTLAVVHHLGPHPERRPEEAEQYWRKVETELKAILGRKP